LSELTVKLKIILEQSNIESLQHITKRIFTFMYLAMVIAIPVVIWPEAVIDNA
jgi:hypothetical protein